MVVNSRWLVLVATIVLIAGSVFACKVPVFRFALERWPADNYRVVAITDGDPNDETEKAITALHALAESPANVEVEVIDLQTLTDAQLWQVEGLEDTADAPLLQVFFPQREGQRELCWSGKLTKANVDAWGDSPLRKRIAGDIQSGVSAVWVVVEGADAKANQQLRSDLQAALEEAAEQIAIPDGVIKREDASRYLAEHKGASMDDVLRSKLPLKIQFTVQTLSHQDQKEMAVAAMIGAFASVDDAPFVFPVFGRGRMIEPLSAQRFNSAAIVGACQYMVGECSCVVKTMNPGVDLILSTDWQQSLGDEIVLVDVPIDPNPQLLTIPEGASETVESESTIGENNVIGMVALGIAIAAVVLLVTRKMQVSK